MPRLLIGLTLAGVLAGSLAGCLGLGGDDDAAPAASFADASMRLYASLARQGGTAAPPAQVAAGQTAAVSRIAAQPDDREDAAVAEDDEDAPAAQVAALPPDNDPGVALRVLFQDRASGLSPLAESDLDDLAAQLLREDELPVQILAYWSLADGSPSGAKLQALKRGLTVRSYLTEKGLRQVQIELTQVRAEEAPPLVVDVVLARA